MKIERTETNRQTKTQYCAFILWGNGFAHAPEILDAIREHPALTIEKVFLHHTDDISRFVKDVYANDDVPKAHLREKTRYLRRLNDPNVVVVLAQNSEPNEILRGRDEFRHIESKTIKDLKEDLRNRFNPKKDGVRTEEHVIHATDSEHHLDHLLKVLGFTDGLATFTRSPNAILPVRHYLKPFAHFSIVTVPVDAIYCRILMGDKRSIGSELVPLIQSPHYAFLLGEEDRYTSYIDEFRGLALTDDYAASKFKALASSLRYLEPPHALDYIVVTEFQLGKYVIHDGLHRAAIIAARGESSIPVAIIRG